MIEPWPSLDKLGDFARIDGEQMKREAAQLYDGTAQWNVEVPTYYGSFALGASAFGVTTVLWPGFGDSDIYARHGHYRIAYGSRGKKVAIEAGIELMGFVVGEVKRFETPVDLSYLTPFQQDVLAAVRQVPYGQTLTVAELAQAAGHPRKYAPILTVLRHNPIPVIVPCHRILPTKGGTGDWSGPPGFKQDRKSVV